MVTNLLIGGGVPDNSGAMLEDYNGSLYDPTSPANADVAALVRAIPSQDLIPFGMVDNGYDESFLRNENVMCSIPTLPTDYQNTFPTLEEHDNAKLLFELNLKPANGGKNNWYYSAKLEKVFIRMDQPFYIQLMYQCRPDLGDVAVRAMMVFRDDIGLPVKRCNNHKHTSKDPDAPEALVESVIRCDNSNAFYNGNAAGKNVNDRLSLWIPLSVVKPDEKNFIRQSLALKFVCQNSCIGRRPTAVIFTLENRSGEVLSKRFINVKICSCPKRDKEKEEGKANELKRTADEANLPPGKRLMKIPKIKEEPEDAIQDESQSESENIGEDGVRAMIIMPDDRSMRAVMEYCFAEITKRMALDQGNPKKYSSYFHYFKKKIVTADEPKNKSPKVCCNANM